MTLRKSAITSLFWTGTSQFGSQIISFVVNILMARILLPEDFGVIAITMIFANIGNMLVDGGMSQSIIRSTNVNSDDLNTVFTTNLLVSIGVYIIIYTLAPWLASLYDSGSMLVDVVRLFSLTIIIRAFSAIQKTLFTRNLDFKTQTKITLPAMIISSFTTVIFANFGFGVFSIVYGNILLYTLTTFFYCLKSSYLPKIKVNKKSLKKHFGFGYKLTLSGIINVIFENSYSLIIGKFFSMKDLGFFNRADNLKQLPAQNFSAVISKVSYPIFSKVKNDSLQLQGVFKRFLELSVFIIAPVLFTMSALAEPLFRFLITEKWLPAVPLFRILCLNGILYPIHAYNLNILQVLDRTDLFLKLEILKKTVLVLIVVSSYRFGIEGLLFGSVLTSLISFFINAWHNSKNISYGPIDQLKDLLPILIASMFSGIITFALDTLFRDYLSFDILRIFVGTIISISTYLIMAYFFNLRAFRYILNLLKNDTSYSTLFASKRRL